MSTISQNELGSKAGQHMVEPPEKIGPKMFRINPPLGKGQYIICQNTPKHS